MTDQQAFESKRRIKTALLLSLVVGVEIFIGMCAPWAFMRGAFLGVGAFSALFILLTSIIEGQRHN